MTMMKCPVTMTMMKCPMNNDNDEMPYKYDNDNDTAITEVKYDRNMTNDELKDVGTKDVVL